MPGIAERREMIERIRRHLPKRDAVEAANAESRIYDKALEYLDWGWYHSEMDRLYPPKQRKQRADGTAGSDSDDSVILVGDRNRAPAAPAAPAAQVPAAPLDRAEKALKGLYDTHGLQYQTRDDRQAAADAARAAEKLAAAEARASALEEQNRKLNQSNQKLANEVQRLQALASDPDEIGKLKVQLQEAHAAMAANNDRAAELVKEIEQWKAVAEGPEPPPTKKAPKQAERNKQLSKTNRELLATVRTYQVLEKDTARLLDRLRRENAYFRSKLKLPQVPYGSGAGVAAGGGVPKLPKPRKPGHLPTVARAPAASSSSAAAGGDGAGEAPPKGGTLVTFPPRPKPSGSGSLQAPSVPGALPEAWTSRAPGAASGSGSGSAQQPATPTSTEAPSLPAYASSQAPAQPITAAPVVLPIAPHQQERERERLVLPEKKATRMDLDSDRD
ncbi:hypothetical protein DFJ74DRAFT_658769 [Hyaloraphidium curvatum]|nr:hypothetical protein DFJ74DRAFT_658769 [Hyaloraphidium curvatum]